MIFSLNHIFFPLILIIGGFFLVCTPKYVIAGDCTTTADDTWDCGTPDPADNLIVNHTVSIMTVFEPTGSITINSGGQLTFTEDFTASGCDIYVYPGGTLIIHGVTFFHSNTTLTNDGYASFSNNLTLDNSASLMSSLGYTTVSGHILITQGATVTLEANSTLHASDNIEFNTNEITINGLIDIEGGFVNNKSITGTGKIKYNDSCSGSGTINDVTSDIFCGSNPIDLSSLSCGTDTTDPVISDMPVDMILDAPVDACEIIATWTAPTATDNCSLQSLTSSYNSGDLFPVGTTTVTYTAVDASSNTVSASFDITVKDNLSPAIDNLPADIIQNADADTCGAIVNWTPPTATDNCSAALSSSHNPVDFFDVGTTTVTYTADDGNGNSTALSFDITIKDNLSPAIDNLPADIVQNADVDTCGAIVNWTPPTATDNCSASLSSSHNPGDFFNVGTTTVTYTADDGNGNSTALSFDIIVNDKTAPEFTFCPSTFTVESIDSLSFTSIITWEEPVASDICSSIKMRSNYKSGDQFNFGKSTVIYTAKDQSGNKSKCRFDISCGFNRSPVVNSIVRKATAGESIDIVLDVEDPEGDQTFIEEIIYNECNSVISNIDYEHLSFVYTSLEDFFGNDTLHVKVADNGSHSKSAIAEVVVEVERTMIVKVSSAITVNGDMINDVWYLKNIDLFPNNSDYIYDRWGGLIYQSSGYDNNRVVWNGRINQNHIGNQKFVSAGTYFYVIDPGNGMEKLTGAVEVIR